MTTNHDDFCFLHQRIGGHHANSMIENTRYLCSLWPSSRLSLKYSSRNDQISCCDEIYHEHLWKGGAFLFHGICSIIHVLMCVAGGWSRMLFFLCLVVVMVFCNHMCTAYTDAVSPLYCISIILIEYLLF